LQDRKSLSGAKLCRCPLSGFVNGFKFILKLLFANFGQELAHLRTRLHTHGEQVIASKQRGTNFGLFFKFFRLFNQVIIDIQTAVGADAVKAMKLEFEREGGTHQQAAQGGFAHLKYIFELHMAADSGDNVLDLFARKTEAFENLLRHVGADAFVFVKMDAARPGMARSCPGFGNVMK
jgi:hypothetical protein